jgi:hypothetical protein
MATIPKAGITTSSTIEAAHVTNIIDALDGTTSREIKIPGSMQVVGAVQVTGSLDTKGVNTHTNTNTFDGAVTVNGTFDLSSSTSAFRSRLQVLNNQLGVAAEFLDFVAGTTFEIDLGYSAINDVVIDFTDPDAYTHCVEYNIRFCRDAAGAGATLQLRNGGSNSVQGLNCNTNAAFTIANGQKATTTQTGLIYSHIKINSVQNSGASAPYWQMRVWSNHSGLFTIT